MPLLTMHRGVNLFVWLQEIDPKNGKLVFAMLGVGMADVYPSRNFLWVPTSKLSHWEPFLYVSHSSRTLEPNMAMTQRMVCFSENHKKGWYIFV